MFLFKILNDYFTTDFSDIYMYIYIYIYVYIYIYIYIYTYSRSNIRGHQLKFFSIKTLKSILDKYLIDSKFTFV